MIVIGYVNVTVYRLFSNKEHLQGRFGLDSCYSENWVRLLFLCLDHGLLIAGVNLIYIYIYTDRIFSVSYIFICFLTSSMFSYLLTTLRIIWSI